MRGFFAALRMTKQKRRRGKGNGVLDGAHTFIPPIAECAMDGTTVLLLLSDEGGQVQCGRVDLPFHIAGPIVILTVLLGDDSFAGGVGASFFSSCSARYPG